MATKKRGTKVSTYQRESGRWGYRFEGAKVDGTRKWFTKVGFATSQEAYDAGIIAYNQYRNTGKSFTPSDLSVADYLDYWMDTYGKTNLKKTTLEGYQKKIRLYIKPALGSYYLKDLEPATIQEFMNKMFNDGFARNTLTAVKGILTRSLDYAVTTAKFISVNPADSVRLPLPRAKAKVETRKKERTVYTDDQIVEIFKRFPEGHSCHIPLILGYHCGTRLGETFAVTWDDFNVDRRQLTVNKQVQYHNGEWFIVDTKYESVRTIDLDDECYNVLLRAKEKIDKAIPYYGEFFHRLYLDDSVNGMKRINSDGIGQEVHFINTREDGTFIQPRVLQHCYRIIHYQLGYEDTDFHSLRHTHASNLLAAGCDPTYVQERLGHKDVATTLRTYAHVTELMRLKNIEKLNNIKIKSGTD